MKIDRGLAYTEAIVKQYECIDVILEVSLIYRVNIRISIRICSPTDLSRGWVRIFRMTKAMEIASLDDVSEKGTLKGDHGDAAHPGCHTVRERVGE